MLGKSSDGDDALYSIVDKVKGENLNKIEPNPELARKSKNCMRRLLNIILINILSMTVLFFWI